MGKKNKKSKKAEGKPTVEEKTEKPLVTMADLEAMSDSDESALPPEEEWDADAKALKKAIEEGAFDKAMKEYQEGKNNGDDDSIEEVELDGDGSEDDGDDDDDDDVAEKVDADRDEEEESSSEDEKDGEENDDDEEEEASEDEESEDEHDDSKAKASSKPQHKTDERTHRAVEESDSDDNKEEGKEEEVQEVSEEGNSEEESEDEDEGEKEDPDAMNTKALRAVTEGLSAFRRSMPWAESFTVTPPTTSPFAPGAESSLDIHDDLKREVAFYDLALEAALEARKKCAQGKIPFSRPDDFFAEMVKTDEHMARIKDRLIFENKKMEAVAQRKSNKEQKLRAKEAQSNKLAEKAKRKKEHFKAVQEWAQSAASQRGGAVNDQVDEGFLRRMNNGPNKKRQAADRKYGFGGKRGRFKKTDPATLNDMSGYNRRGNFEGGQKRSASAAGGKRPGKRARQARSKR